MADLLNVPLLDVASARLWVEAFVASFVAHQAELTDLDRRAGDGDFGTNLAGPLYSARAALEAAGHDASVGAVFEALVAPLMRAGGTSGPLFGVFFKELARCGGEAAGVGLDDLAGAAQAAVAAVQRLGGAKVGDATMVDSMVPAAQALVDATRDGTPLPRALRSAAVAARTGADSTASMLARRGRASYVGEVALGVLDPGAVAVALFFEAAPVFEAAPGASDVAGERETLEWSRFGCAIRELAEMIAADGYRPDLILAIARGGLFVAGALGYALSVKNIYVMNVEYYTGVDERLPLPVVLPPVPDLIDLESARVLVADDVADTGHTLALVHDFCKGKVADVRAAVLYQKPLSIIACEYVWARTDRWIAFPWSSQTPVWGGGAADGALDSPEVGATTPPEVGL